MSGRIAHMILWALAFLLSGCGTRYVPKPYAYYRIDLPPHAYQTYEAEEAPCRFAYSTQAVITQEREHQHPTRFNIYYRALDARIHCTYLPVESNLRELSADAQEFVYKHAGKASAIPEQGYENADERVFGVYYELKGNTASPFQFYLTDSVHHFFRAAVYINCVPNQDSLAPVISYLQTDVRRMIESFGWEENHY